MIERFLEMRKHLIAQSPSPKAQLELYVFSSDTGFTLAYRPYGYVSSGNTIDIFGKGASLEDAFSDTLNKWQAISDEVSGKRVVAMAEVIAAALVTHDAITDGDLRMKGFHDAEIETLGPRACVLAAEAANKHPVTITKIENSNGAPAVLTDDIPF